MVKGGIMSNTTKLISVIVFLLVLQLSCTKLPQGLATTEGSFPTEKVIQTNSIPPEWGKLISVAISPDFPRVSQLWFQDEKGDIHLAFYDLSQNKLSPNVVVLRRI
jgi:hypothetical protein